MRHTISVLLDDRFGELPRLVGLFSAKLLEIESLSLSPTHDAKVACATIVTRGEAHAVEQIVKLLNRQVRVLSACDVSGRACIERETAFIKISSAEAGERQQALNLAALFNARVVDASETSFILEATGDGNTVRGLIQSLKPFGIQQVVRTGTAAIERLTNSF